MHGDVRDLGVVGLQVLAPPVVLGQQKAVVGRQEQHRVLPHVVPVEVVEQLAEVVIAGRHQRRVVGADLGDFMASVATLMPLPY